jgi:cytochrome c oxidase subunit IV
MSEHIAEKKMYFIIWGALMLGTALTAGLSFVDIPPPYGALVALLIAGTKATLVVLFFMHMKWSDGPTRMAAVAGLFWLVIMFMLTVSDFWTRHWMTYGG